MDKSALNKSRGLSLVELLVALVVGSILSMAIITVMGYGARMDATSADLQTLNDDARGALLLISRDMQSAGFLAGNIQAQCAVTLSYNSAQTPSYAQTPPISADSQALGQTLPYQSTPANYPPQGSGIVAQSLLTVSAQSASSYINQTSSPIYVVQFGTTQSMHGLGAINSTQLPVSTLQLNTTQGLSQGDTAYLQVPMIGGNVCFRIPIVKTGTATSSTTYIKSKPSPRMPSNGYSDFAAQIPAAMGTLTNSNLLHARMLNLGDQPNTLQLQQWSIDASSGYPVLTRTTYSALTDQSLGSQAIAPGVVSLQFLFGVVPANSPANTPPTWKTWGDVAPTDQVVLAAVAIVLRTLHSDPSYQSPGTITLPQPASNLSAPDAFVPYTVPASQRNNHFAAYTTIIPLRNITWNAA